MSFGASFGAGTASPFPFVATPATLPFPFPSALFSSTTPGPQHPTTAPAGFPAGFSFGSTAPASTPTPTLSPFGAFASSATSTSATPTTAFAPPTLFSSGSFGGASGTTGPSFFPPASSPAATTTAATKITEAISEQEVLVRCSVCSEHFCSQRKPLSLPCAHIICEVCTEQLKQTTRKCPCCTKELQADSLTPVNQMGLEFAVMFRSKTLGASQAKVVEEESMIPTCGCKEGCVEEYCLDCQDVSIRSKCAACMENDHRRGVFAKHRRRPWNAETDAEPEVPLCTERHHDHQKKLHFCVPCKILVCHYCTARGSTHSEHEIKSVMAVAAELQAGMNSLMATNTKNFKHAQALFEDQSKVAAGFINTIHADVQKGGDVEGKDEPEKVEVAGFGGADAAAGRAEGKEGIHAPTLSPLKPRTFGWRCGHCQSFNDVAEIACTSQACEPVNAKRATKVMEAEVLVYAKFASLQAAIAKRQSKAIQDIHVVAFTKKQELNQLAFKLGCIYSAGVLVDQQVWQSKLNTLAEKSPYKFLDRYKEAYDKLVKVNEEAKNMPSFYADDFNFDIDVTELDKFTAALPQLVEVRYDNGVAVPEELRGLGVTKANVNQLLAWVGLTTGAPAVVSLQLQYRATEHGFAASAFHSNCDAKRRLLVVCRNASGYVFGGFSTKAFTSSSFFGSSPPAEKAFLFSLINPQHKPAMYAYRGSSSGVDIWHGTTSGPTYGGSILPNSHSGSTHDLYICSNSNVTAGSCSTLGKAYTSDSPYAFQGVSSLGLMTEILAFQV